MEIREAYRNLMNQKRQIEIAEKSIKNAELTYAINLEPTAMAISRPRICSSISSSCPNKS